MAALDTVMGNFIATTSENLDDITIKKGQLIFVKDKREFYLDLENQRIPYQSIVVFETDSDRLDVLDPVQGFYYVQETNMLWSFFDDRWIKVVWVLTPEDKSISIDDTNRTIKVNISAREGNQLILTNVNGEEGLFVPAFPTKLSEFENDMNFTDNIGTITGIILNGTNKGTSGVVDLGNVLTEHQDISGKLDIANIVDNLNSTDTNKPLSANMGKTIQEEINNLKSRGRFLALWNSATGLPMSDPQVNPYIYQTGDYYIVGAIDATTNYRPIGSSYTIGLHSSTVETLEVAIDDVYYYDGTEWRLQSNVQKTLSFANIAGQPEDNANLAAALNTKQDTLISGTNIKTINGESILGSGDITLNWIDFYE